MNKALQLVAKQGTEALPVPHTFDDPEGQPHPGRSEPHSHAAIAVQVAVAQHSCRGGVVQRRGMDGPCVAAVGHQRDLGPLVDVLLPGSGNLGRTQGSVLWAKGLQPGIGAEVETGVGFVLPGKPHFLQLPGNHRLPPCVEAVVEQIEVLGKGSFEPGRWHICQPLNGLQRIS